MDNDVILVNHYAFYFSFVHSHALKAHDGKAKNEICLWTFLIWWKDYFMWSVQATSHYFSELICFTTLYSQTIVIYWRAAENCTRGFAGLVCARQLIEPWSSPSDHSAIYSEALIRPLFLMGFRTAPLTLISMLLPLCVAGNLHLSNTFLLFDSAAGSTGGRWVGGERKKAFHRCRVQTLSGLIQGFCVCQRPNQRWQRCVMVR